MTHLKLGLLLLLLGLSACLKSQTKSDSLSILFNRMHNSGLMLNEYYKLHTNGLIKCIGGTLGTSAFTLGALTTESVANRTLFGFFAAASSVISIMGVVDLWSSHKYIQKAAFYLNPNQTGLSLGYRF